MKYENQNESRQELWKPDYCYYESEKLFYEWYFEHQKDLEEQKHAEQKADYQVQTKDALAKDHGKDIASMPTIDNFSDHSDNEGNDVETNDIESFDYDNLHLSWSPDSSPKLHF